MIIMPDSKDQYVDEYEGVTFIELPEDLVWKVLDALKKDEKNRELREAILKFCP